MSWIVVSAREAGESAEFSSFALIVGLPILVLYFGGIWGTFVKAGQPGWAAIVPVYNAFVLTRIAGRPGWWVLLMLVPIVDFVVLVILCLDIAAKFGRGPGFGFGLALLGLIFWPILGWGASTYRGAPVHA